MIYVERDQDGAVKGLYAVAQPGYADEALAEDDPAVRTFQAQADGRVNPLDALQTRLAQVEARAAALETVLIDRALLTNADIDAAVADMGQPDDDQ